MSNIFYNAHTHADAPKRIITGVQEVEAWHSTFFEWAERRGRVANSQEEAMQATYAGSVYWRENGKAYEGYLRQPWEFKPVETHESDPGINWCTHYAISVDELVKALPCCREEDIRRYAQATEYGLYEVQVHFSGRVR